LEHSSEGIGQRGESKGSDSMIKVSKKMVLLAIVTVSFLILAGCVGYVAYPDYDYPYGPGYYSGGIYYYDYGHHDYDHHDYDHYDHHGPERGER
jgi:hypothetical protein